MPSSSRLRQRFDEDAFAMMPLIDDSLAEVAVNLDAPVTDLPIRLDKHHHITLDIDVFNFESHSVFLSEENVQVIKNAMVPVGRVKGCLIVHLRCVSMLSSEQVAFMINPVNVNESALFGWRGGNPLWSTFLASCGVSKRVKWRHIKMFQCWIKCYEFVQFV
ncbi:MAG: hypothetical protein KAG53_09460 [Endozoicomonadaceae bacterium]|nr:hypothetical protein [Endozoicomonadaceae bacterium]